jgi:hypothetical protein
MSGLYLASMEASDMLDVLHYLFEEDIRFSTAEQAQAVDKGRQSIYQTMYGVDYKYAANSSSRSNDFTPTASNDDFESITPFTPNKNAVKPYVPPTQFDPDMGLPGLIEPSLK